MIRKYHNACNTQPSSDMHAYQIPYKISKSTSLKVHRREIIQTCSKGEQRLLHIAHNIALIRVYMPFMYHQNITKCIRVVMHKILFKD